jgi:hypothetical protein
VGLWVRRTRRFLRSERSRSQSNPSAFGGVERTLGTSGACARRQGHRHDHDGGPAENGHRRCRASLNRLITSAVSGCGIEVPFVLRVAYWRGSLVCQSAISPPAGVARTLRQPAGPSRGSRRVEALSRPAPSSWRGSSAPPVSQLRRCKMRSELLGAPLFRQRYRFTRDGDGLASRSGASRAGQTRPSRLTPGTTARLAA